MLLNSLRDWVKGSDAGGLEMNRTKRVATRLEARSTGWAPFGI